MKRIYITLISGLLIANASAQSDNASDTARTEAPEKKSNLTLGVAWSNNASYYGQSASETMPYLLAMASWHHYSGFYLTGASYKLLKESGGLVSASSLGTGIDFHLAKNLSADVSFSHTFYPSQSSFLQAANANNASASVSLENWLTTTANVDYAFGKTNDIFTSASVSKSIGLGTLFSQNDLLSITPSAEVVGGTRHFYETYITEKRLRDSLAGIALPPLIDNSGDGESASTVKPKTSFNLVSYNFSMPLAYSRANYQVQVVYQLSVISKKTAGKSGQANSFFTANFYYQF
jgi:hypothetical protein